ncbi:TIGR04053 family radical SAM/SPASM domain-containing protein OS=Streptomyces rimosus subsp.rimosus (strain ATCC / DSM 40260 / JCM 4667 / NRRL 2234)OX=1265868 GN=SRIM_004155 PE=4 SV=1 [Streptomyces rimosus subsp. rimosus]
MHDPARPAPAPAPPPVSGARAVRRQHQAVADRPFIVIWESTRACPLACVHCRATGRARGRDPRELGTRAAKGLIDQIAAFGRPAPLFVITGGDPFQRPDLLELIVYGTRAGVRVAVWASGTPTLTAANLRAVHEVGAVGLSLSLDGSTAALHDGFRGVPGVFRWTLDALGHRPRPGHEGADQHHGQPAQPARPAGDRGPGPRARRVMLWSASPSSHRTRPRPGRARPRGAEDVLNFVHDVGLSMPRPRPPRGPPLPPRRPPARGAGRAGRRHHVEVLRLGPLYRQLRERGQELGLYEGGRRTRRPPLDVNAGRGFVFVSHTGTVHPSGFLPLAAGDVRTRPLTEIYRESELFTGLRDADRLGGRCGRCEFRRVCGGSRSRAHAVTGDPYAEEPWCGYRPGTFPYQREVAELLGGAGPTARGGR